MVLIKSDLTGLAISGGRIMSEIRWRPAGMESSAGCTAVFVQGVW